jgi:hypothetical protein
MPEKDSPETTFEKINPQTMELEVGIRSLRNITIYPLSMADQLRATDLIAQAMQGFVQKEGMEDTEFIAFAMELIKANLAKIIGMAVDEDGEKLLEELSNPQGMALVEAIFEMNYASISGNVQSLAEKVKKLFPSARQSLQ